MPYSIEDFIEKSEPVYKWYGLLFLVKGTYYWMGIKMAHIQLYPGQHLPPGFYPSITKVPFKFLKEI